MRSRDRITVVLGLVTLAVSVLAIGGATRPVVIAISLLAAILAASQARSRRRLERLSPLLLVIAVPIVLTAVQLVPLPPGVNDALNPTAHELIVDGEVLLDPDAKERPASWHPISGDPATSRTELAKFCAYLLIAWMALRAAASERGRVFLISGVAGLAGVVAIIGAVHELLGATTLFGVYEPAHANPIVMAPLLNPNHLACFMVFGAVLAGGLAMNERRAPPIRVLWIVVALACIAMALTTRSRGGVLGLAAGATTATALTVLQRLRAKRSADRREAMRVVIPGAIILLCSLVLAIYLGGGGVREELESTRLDELSSPNSKYGAWRSALDLVEEAPLFGIGRGAFESTFTRVHDVSGLVTFSHLENEYLQVVVDWGVLGAIVFGLALAFCGAVAARRWKRGPLPAAAIGALAAVAVHSVVDFGMEIPGLAVPVILVAATLLYVPLVEGSRSLNAAALRFGCIALAIVTALFAALPSGRTLDEDHQVFAEREPTSEEARASLRRHPLDYVSAAQVAGAATTSRDRSAFLNHALRLHPHHPGLHRATAVWLAQSGRPKQAALEYRLALLGTGNPEALLREIVAFFPLARDAADALPETHPLWLRIVTELTTMKRGDVAVAYMLDIAKVVPRPTRELWQRILTTAEPLGDLVAAERAAWALSEMDRTSPSKIELARIQLKAKKYPQAKQTLAPLLVPPIQTKEQIEAQVLLCDIQIDLQAWQVAKDCLGAALQLPSELALRKKIHSRMAKAEDALGNHVRASFERKLAGEEK